MEWHGSAGSCGQLYPAAAKAWATWPALLRACMPRAAIETGHRTLLLLMSGFKIPVASLHRHHAIGIGTSLQVATGAKHAYIMAALPRHCLGFTACPVLFGVLHAH